MCASSSASVRRADVSCAGCELGVTLEEDGLDALFEYCVLDASFGVDRLRVPTSALTELDLGPGGALSWISIGARSAFVAPDFQFQISVPGRVFQGDRAGFADYIRGRDVAGKQRVHHVIARARAGAVEFVLGEVREHGAVIGTFHSTSRVTAEGTLDRYVSYFQTDIRMVTP